MMTLPTLLLSAALGLSPTAAAADQQIGADELVKKFIQRSQEEDKQNLDQKYGFIEHRIHDELDKNGQVKVHRDLTFQRISVEGQNVLRLVAKDGKPLTADEQAKQAEREKTLLAERRKKQAEKKPKPSSDDDFQVDEQFMSHFKFDIIGREDINGRPSYVVTVLPQPSVHPVRSNGEKIFTHMQGKVWVDADDYSMAKCDVHLSEPTSFYGVLGAIRQLDLLMQRRHVDRDVWIQEKVSFEVDGRRLFTSFRMKQTSDFTDFRPLASQKP